MSLDGAAKPGLARGVVAVWLTVILAVAAALRVVGLQFGFPFTVHPDEWAIVENAVDLAKRGSFEPTFLDRPDHLEIKLNYLLDSVFSQVRFGQPLEVAFEQHPLSFYLMARIITAIFGLACVVLAFLIGKRINPATGLIAAALFAVFPPLVEHSHYATPEMPQLAFTLLTVLLCQYYLAKPGVGMAALIGVSIGAAVTIKYPAILSTVVVAVVISVAAVRLRSWRVWVGHGTVAILSVLGAVAVISPVLLTEFDRVWIMIGQQGQPNHLGADGLNWFGNANFYFSTFMVAAGVLLALAALGGAIWSVWRRPVDTLPFWTGLVFWLALSAVALHWQRWAVPMYTTALLFAAVGLQVFFAWGWARRPGGSRGALVARRAALVVLGVVVGLNQVVAATAVTASLVAGDTRVEGKRFAESIGATEKNTIFEGYSPLLPGAPWSVFEYFSIRDGQLYLSKKAPKNAKFLILSSGMKGRYLANPRYVDEQYFYSLVAEQLPMIGSFIPAAGSSARIWEPLNIAQQADLIVRYASGGNAGPAVVFYDLSGLERDGGS